MRLAPLVLALAATCAALGQASDGPAELTDTGLGSALERAQELARRHRYLEVINLLEPFSAVAADDEAVYALSAELGRALFHLGRYPAAHQAFRRSAALRPERVETALYLQATSYLTGNREQALAIFREILRSGARDLYLAVTLPGERQFLSEPEVWRLMEASRRPAHLDLEQGRFMGVTLGQQRPAVVATLGAPEAGEGQSLSAHAGPAMLWAFSFDDADRLTEILIVAEHLLRYTSYGLDLGNQQDWRVTPAAAITMLGPPVDVAVDQRGDQRMAWTTPHARVELEFGFPEEPRPPSFPAATALLRVVRLTARAPDGSASMDP